MTQDRTNTRHRLASLLRQVADGQTPADVAIGEIERWRHLDANGRLFDDAYHALRHVAADEDIRQRDASYASNQMDAIKRLAARLEQS